MPVPELKLRLEKGAPLTPGEMDNNFTLIVAFANGLETRLNVTLAADGTMKANVVDTNQLKDGAVTAIKIAEAVLGKGLKRTSEEDKSITLNIDGTTLVLEEDEEEETWFLRVAPAIADFGVGGLYICAAEEQVANTDGGTFTQVLEITRKLNVLRANEVGGVVALGASGNANAPVGNKLTLPAGTYRCHIMAPAVQAGGHKAWLYNATANADIIVGTSAVTGSGADYATTYSIISGKFTLADQSDVEIRHRCSSTKANTGLGRPTGFKTEVYTVAEFWKLA